MSSQQPHLTGPQAGPSLAASGRSHDLELAFLPARAWQPPAPSRPKAGADIDGEDTDSNHSRTSPILRFQLDPPEAGAVGDVVSDGAPAVSAQSKESPDPSSASSPLVLDEDKKRLEAERKEKRRELLSRTVYVRGLPATMPQSEFAAMLLDCGTYNRVRICGNAPEGQNYIYGFVEFATTAGAEKMMTKSGTELQNGCERAPLRLDCTRVKRPIMDKVAEDADPERGVPCTFGVSSPARDGAVRTLGDVLHVVPPNVQAKAALRKGIERCACGCDGDNCCACCRCFSKAVNKPGTDAKGGATASSSSCCGGCSHSSDNGINNDNSNSGDGTVPVTTRTTGSCCGACDASSPSPNDEEAADVDLDVLLAARKEQLATCTALLAESLTDATVRPRTVAAWSTLCDDLRLDQKQRSLRLPAPAETPQDVTTDSVDVVVVEWVRLHFFVMLITASALLSRRRATKALAVFEELKATLTARMPQAQGHDRCHYACSIACFAAMSLEPTDVDLALAFYQIAEAFRSRDEVCADNPTARNTQHGRASAVATKRACLASLTANLGDGGPALPPDTNPALPCLFDLCSPFFCGVASPLVGSHGDVTAVPRWILGQVCDWKTHTDTIRAAQV